MGFVEIIYVILENQLKMNLFSAPIYLADCSSWVGQNDEWEGICRERKYNFKSFDRKIKSKRKTFVGQSSWRRAQNEQDVE